MIWTLKNCKSFFYSNKEYLIRFWLPGWGDIALFRIVPWLAWSPRLVPNTPNTKLFSPQKSCSTIKLFFVLKYVLYKTVLSKYVGEKSWVTVLVSSQTALKGGRGFEIEVRMDNLRGGDGGEIQNKAHRVPSMQSRSSLFSVVFICLITPTQKFKLEKSTLIGLIFAWYVPLASQSPYPITVYAVANYRPHLSHFWENM